MARIVTARWRCVYFRRRTTKMPSAKRIANANTAKAFDPKKGIESSVALRAHSLTGHAEVAVD
jgi:hypothetical protein